MNKELLVKQAFEGYIETAENENKIIIDLNTFDEEVKNYLNNLHSDDDNYCYGDDDKFLDLTSELNRMLIDLFEKNNYDVYEAGGIYVEDGQFKNVNPDTAVAIKKII